MAKHAHLYRRQAVYWWRRRIPKNLRHFFSISELRFSLKTHMAAEAATRAARLRVVTDLAFQDLERAVTTGVTLPDQTVDQLVNQLVREELARCERERERAGPRTEADIQQAMLEYQRQRARLQHALRTNTYAELEQHLAPAVEAVRSVATDSDLAVLRRRAARGLLDATHVNEAREQGIYVSDAHFAAVAANAQHFSAPVHATPSVVGDHVRTGSPRAVEPEGPVRAESQATGDDKVVSLKRDRTAAPRPSAEQGKAVSLPRSGDGGNQSPTGSRISEVKDAFLADQAKSMKRHYRVAIDLLEDGLDDPVLSELSRASVVEVVILISQLPVTHGKSAKTTLPIREQVARTNAEETEAIEAAVQLAKENGGDRKTIARDALEVRIERLSAEQSLTNHRRRINSFLKWCHKKEYLPQALQIDLDDIPRQVRDDAKNRDEQKGARLSWGRDQLQKLLTSSIMTDPTKDFGDPMFWSILAGPHQGPRMEEFLQLGPDDVEVQEGIPVILIRHGLGQHAKTAAAQRVLPIHPVLIAAGFLDLVEQRRAEGSHWLFPMLDHGHDGRFSSVFTKRFSRYREDERLYDAQRDYHSLRSDFQETLEDADVPLNARKRLLGHRVEDITEGKYRKRDYSVSRKAEYINLIDYGIEVERVDRIPVVRLCNKKD